MICLTELYHTRKGESDVESDDVMMQQAVRGNKRSGIH